MPAYSDEKYKLLGLKNTLKNSVNSRKTADLEVHLEKVNSALEEKDFPNAKIDFHVHPFFEKYGFEAVIKKAMEKNIRVLGLEHYNNNIFPEIAARATAFNTKEYSIEYDKSLIENSSLLKISKNSRSVYFPKCTEVSTKEKIHVLVIGDYDKIEPDENLHKTIEKGLENDCLVMLDHPYVDSEKTHKPITKRTKKFIEETMEKYGNKIFIEKNGYCRDDIWNALSKFYYLPDKFTQRKNLRRGMSDSVNKAAEDIAKIHGIKVIADTDLHARTSESLNYLALSNIEIPEEKLDFSSGKSLIKTVKESINSGNYKNNTVYPSIRHLAFEYVLPNVLAPYLNVLRPRG